MKTIPAQQEILLLASSTLSKTALCATKDSKDKPCTTEWEALEKACWDGLLLELIPELAMHTPGGQPLYLWHIRKGNCCLQLELSEFPLSIDKPLSIDPYLFLTTVPQN